MIFDQEFLERVDIDPVGSIVSASNRTISRLEQIGLNGWTDIELNELQEAAALIANIIEAHNLYSENYLPESSRNFYDTCHQLFQYVKSAGEEFQAMSFDQKLSSLKDRYKAAINSTFAYEFSQGDLDRIQVLVNELRGQISSTSRLDEKHRQRLLARLEKLQSELHKRVSDLDRFWGLVGDAGVALGKLGTDAKPIVERIKEISEIVWRTQARTEELPSNTPHPLLGNELDGNTRDEDA